VKALVLEDQNYTAALGVVRALGARGHVADVAAPWTPWSTPATLSRWCARGLTAPLASDRRRYADFVSSLLDGGAYDIGFACTDSVIEIISHMRADLPARPDFLLPPQESLEIALGKLSSQRFAAELGLPTPRTTAIHAPHEISSVARDLGFPLVIKGDKGSGGSHVRYSANMEELRQAYRATAARARVGQPIAQEFIPGDVYLTHVLYDHGEPVAICSHMKERHFPASGGITARGITVHHPELDRQAIRIFSALRWHGPAKADFKCDQRDGRFKLMELDPRISASIDIPAAAGVDMIEMCCRMVCGERVEPRLEYATGIRVRYVCRDMLCLAAQPSLLPRFILDALDPRIRSNFNWHDLRGSLGLMWRAKWAFEDAWAQGQLTGERSGCAMGVRRSRARRQAHRALLLPVIGGLRIAGVLYRSARLARRGARAALAYGARARCSAGSEGPQKKHQVVSGAALNRDHVTGSE
jgi:hypothetical protein